MANVLLDVLWARLLDVPYRDVNFVSAEGQLGPWSIKGQSHPPVPEVRYAFDEVFGRIRSGSGLPWARRSSSQGHRWIRNTTFEGVRSYLSKN
jgi:hypothetical protein